YWLLLLVGFGSVLIVPVWSPLVWPLVGAVFGVAAGPLAFAPDQYGQSHRMFGDRRVPLGRIWLWKVALPIAVIGVAIVLLASNLLARYLVDGTNSTYARDAFRRDLLWLRSGLTLATLVLGPLYGFACGQFFGLIYRKLVVAAVTSLVTTMAAV